MMKGWSSERTANGQKRIVNSAVIVSKMSPEFRVQSKGGMFYHDKVY